MTCDELRAALSAADGGPLAADGEDHLRDCGDCRRWAVALDRLAGRLAAWTAPPLAEGFDARLRARLARPRTPAWALVAAELLIFALGALAGTAAARLSEAEAPPAADILGVEEGDLVASYWRELK